VVGAMTEARRARLVKRRLSEWGSAHGASAVRPLDSGAVAGLWGVAHIALVFPMVRLYGQAALGESNALTFLATIDPTRPIVAERLVAGRLLRPGERGAALAHEYLLYELGLESEEAALSALGRVVQFSMTVRQNDPVSTLAIVAYRRLGLSQSEVGALDSGLRRLMRIVRFVPMPGAEKAILAKVFSDKVVSSEPAEGDHLEDAYTIVGIYRDVDADSTDRASIFDHAMRNVGLLVTPESGADFHERLSDLARAGYDGVQVLVDDESHVESVVKGIKSLGFEPYSLAEFLGTVRMNVLLVSTATAFIATIALIVSAIGIANTMIMSVLERTREIGIMKALGARDGQIRGIFLLEGAGLGLTGGLLGLLLGWLAHFPGDQVAQTIIQKQVDTPIGDSLFAYPLWLVIGAPLLAATTATLAALYPAMRAARVDPVASLRHD
jgi:putative ABC transport system permease protein